MEVPEVTGGFLPHERSWLGRDPFIFRKEKSNRAETRKGSRLLTLGACGVFGFWKNLVISAFSALMRCDVKRW